MYNIKTKFYILVQLKIPLWPFHVSIKLKYLKGNDEMFYDVGLLIYDFLRFFQHIMGS